MRKAFVSLLILLTASLAAQEQSGTGRQHLEAFAEGLDSLHARFEQRVLNESGMVEDTSSGEVWLQRPHRFRWEYGGDFPEVIVADSRRVWIYDETLEQATVRDQSLVAADSPLVLLTDLAELDAQFTVTELGDIEGVHLLELRARDREAQFERVLLSLQDQALRMMTLEDAFGFRTEIRFRIVERNPELEAGLFVFQPPPGTDVIGDSTP